jgi:HD-GYP domain-containing protein (c-di-GMP phosphodiesterase class II)
MTRLQLSALVDMANPQRVFEEVRTIVLMMFPEFTFEHIERVFKDIERLFLGEYPGYRKSSAEYYDLRHTTDVFLAMARLMHGAVIGGKSLAKSQINPGLICALMHAAGCIRPLEDDNDENDAKYAHPDTGRSIEFMGKYIAQSGISREEFGHYDKVLMGANLSEDISKIRFDSQDTEQLSKMLATATLISQMADRTYLEKLLFPYYGFRQTELMGYETSLELLRKTIRFYEVSRKRLALKLDGLNQYVRFHFKVYWNLDRDLYMEEIEKNIHYLASLMEQHTREYRERPLADEVVSYTAEEPKDEAIKFREIGIKRTGSKEDKRSIQDARECYRKLLALAHKVRSSVESNEPIDISLAVSQLRHIIDNDLIEPLYRCLVYEGNKASGNEEHTIDVTVFSLMVGLGMGYRKRLLLPLALFAFLHDVGMYKIPQEILGKKGGLSEQEVEVVQRHPVKSAEILSGLGDKFSWLANLALQVHERSDGSGYPKGLKENKIHEFASIVGLADMYSAMIKDRPYRDRIEKHKAMKAAIASLKGKLPAKILRAFLNQISFFPVGSYIRLNDRSTGRVINTNPEFPLRPVVEILYDHSGNKPKKPRMIDLSKQPLLYIIESIGEQELT